MPSFIPRSRLDRGNAAYRAAWTRRPAATVGLLAVIAASTVVPMLLVAPPAAAAPAPVVAPAVSPETSPLVGLAPAAAPAPAPAVNEINGVVWLDIDGDGINDATETGFTRCGRHPA